MVFSISGKAAWTVARIAWIVALVSMQMGDLLEGSGPVPMACVLVLSLGMTIMIERGLAVILNSAEGEEVVDPGFVTALNVMTNPLVVLVDIFVGKFLVELMLEIAAVLVEGAYYNARTEVGRPYAFSLLLNGASWGTGLLVNLVSGKAGGHGWTCAVLIGATAACIGLGWIMGQGSKEVGSDAET